MKKLNLAIIGQGRSGKDIHGAYYISDRNEYYNVKYVVDSDEHRRKVSLDRYKGCEVFADYKELFTKKDIDLVVNATYSYRHFDITKDLLEHGFNVLCEKPFTRNRYECEVLTNLAKEKGLVLSAFQQTFYAPFYKDVLRIINDKVIGEVQQVNIRYNGFSRRWDWQTLQKKMAGSTYNTGPHPLGMALGVVGFDDNTKLAFSKLKNTNLSSGDSDDYCKVILDTPNKPVVDVEISSQDAYANYNVKILGDRGTFKCNPFKYEYKYILDEENPKKPVVEEFLADDNGNPMYCSEQLKIHEEKGEYNGTAFDVGTSDLYKELYYKITEGKEMQVTLSMLNKIVRLTEEIYASNPMPVKF